MNIGPYSLLCGGKRVIWFTSHRYPNDLSLLEDLKSLFRFVQKMIHSAQITLKNSYMSQVHSLCKEGIHIQYEYTLSCQSQNNHNMTTYIYPCIYSCIYKDMHRQQYHYIFMKIPNKRDIAHISKERQYSHTSFKCQNVIKVKKYVRQNHSNLII